MTVYELETLELPFLKFLTSGKDAQKESLDMCKTNKLNLTANLTLKQTGKIPVL